MSLSARITDAAGAMGLERLAAAVAPVPVSRRALDWPSAQRIALALGGGFDGVSWRCYCPAHQDDGANLWVAGLGGRLLFHCAMGCSQHEVAGALHGLGHWPDDPGGRFWRRHRPAPIDPAVTTDYARKLWRVCQPAIGTLGEAYLRAQGISCPVPVSFRFATRLQHWPSGSVLPALVCALQDAHGRFCGVERIYLDGLAPAAVDPPTMTLGEPGVLRLGALDGAGLSVVPELLAALRLASAGIEPLWCTPRPQDLRRLVLPPQITEVNVPHQAERGAANAVAALTERLLGEGRSVRWFDQPDSAAVLG